jgi:hypothetical protein
MNGYCKSKDTGIYYFNNQIMVSVHNKQKWQYKYGMRNGENLVKVSRDNVILYLSKDNFEKEWEIIEKAEG